MLKPVLSQLVPAVLILGIGISGLVWLSGESEPPEQTAKPVVPPPVETQVLDPEIRSFTIHTDGNVVPRRVTVLSAQVSGVVIEKPETIESGRAVRAGELLLKIDPQEYQIELDQLAAELLQVDADLSRLDSEEEGQQALLKLAQREAELAAAAFARLKGLAGVNAAGVADLEAAEQTELKARTSVRTLENARRLIPEQRKRLQAQRKLTELRRQEAQLKLDWTTVTAPFDGIVSSIAVEQGNSVQAGDILLSVEDTSSMEVACTLKSDDLYWLWNSVAADTDADEPRSIEAIESDAEHSALAEIPSAEATVSWQTAGREFQWTGRLSRFEGGGFDARTRTVPCRVLVDHSVHRDDSDGPPALMRGMYVGVKLEVVPQDPLWQIPARAVQPDGQVWTVQDGVLRVHSLEPVRTLSDSILIRAGSSGLKAGDHVVITQMTNPLDGNQVRERVIGGDDSP